MKTNNSNLEPSNKETHKWDVGADYLCQLEGWKLSANSSGPSGSQQLFIALGS